jgi:hypothetical protein
MTTIRHTVIRVITAHLRNGAAVSWQGLNFDFTGVVFDGGAGGRRRGRRTSRCAVPGGSPPAARPHRRPARGRAARRRGSGAGRHRPGRAGGGPGGRRRPRRRDVAAGGRRAGLGRGDVPGSPVCEHVQGAAGGHRRAGSGPGRRLRQPGGVPAGHPGPGGRGQPVLGAVARGLARAGPRRAAPGFGHSRARDAADAVRARPGGSLQPPVTAVRLAPRPR